MLCVRVMFLRVMHQSQLQRSLTLWTETHETCIFYGDLFMPIHLCALQSCLPAVSQGYGGSSIRSLPSIETTFGLK